MSGWEIMRAAREKRILSLREVDILAPGPAILPRFQTRPPEFLYSAESVICSAFDWLVIDGK